MGSEIYALAGVLVLVTTDGWVVDHRPPRMMLAGPVVVEKCVFRQETVHKKVTPKSCTATSPVSTHSSDIMMRQPRAATQHSGLYVSHPNGESANAALADASWVRYHTPFLRTW